MNHKIHDKLAAAIHADKINPHDYDPEAEDFSKPPVSAVHAEESGDDDAHEEEVEGEEVHEDDDGEFEINHAAAKNDFGKVKSILDADIHAVHKADSNGWQPIHEAVRAGHTKLVKYLINMGADIGARTHNGGSPLWWAKRTLPKGHPTINYLEQIGAPEEGEEF